MSKRYKLEQAIMTFDGRHEFVTVQAWDARTPEQKAQDLAKWQAENGQWLPEVQGPSLPEA